MSQNKQVATREASHSTFPMLQDTFSELHGEMNRLFDRFLHRDPFKGFGLPSRLKGFDWSPTVDVTERADAYEITAELAGAAEKDIAVSVDKGVLTFSGEKKAERKEDTKDVHFTERQYGSFQRSFTLPDDADAEKISAQFHNGVLKISVPRSKTAKNGARQIAVKAA